MVNRLLAIIIIGNLTGYMDYSPLFYFWGNSICWFILLTLVFRNKILSSLPLIALVYSLGINITIMGNIRLIKDLPIYRDYIIINMWFWLIASLLLVFIRVKDNLKQNILIVDIILFSLYPLIKKLLGWDLEIFCPCDVPYFLLVIMFSANYYNYKTLIK